MEAPPSISLDGAVEGLDATAVMPPLLRPNMLMDLDGYSAWENQGIAVFNDSKYSARMALTIISAATRDACDWLPGRQTLATRVSNAFDLARAAQAGRECASQPPLEHARKAFLASHLFASWAAYQPNVARRGSAQGLGAVIESLELALALVGEDHVDEQSFIATVRAADWRLRHGSHDWPQIRGWRNGQNSTAG